MSLQIDYENSMIDVTTPQTTVLVQDLADQIRDWEATPVGMGYPDMAESSGKVSLGESILVGITLELLGDWQVRFWAGNYIATIKGGNLVGGPGGDPIAYSAGVQVLLVQSAASTVVEIEGGAGFTAADRTKLEDVQKVVRADQTHTKTSVVFKQAGTPAVIMTKQVSGSKLGTGDEIEFTEAP